VVRCELLPSGHPASGISAKGMLQDVALLAGGKAIAEGLELQLKDIQISDRSRRDDHHRQEQNSDRRQHQVRPAFL